jgi:hypothetical protein
MAQDSVAVGSFSQNPAELNGFDGNVLSIGPRAEPTTRRPFKDEVERLTVGAGPLSDEVSDEATVVGGGEIEGFAHCPRQVHPVHPHIPSESDIEEVQDGLAPDGSRKIEKRKVGDGTGQSSS